MLMLILLEVFCVCVKIITKGELETVWFCFISRKKPELDDTQFLLCVQLPQPPYLRRTDIILSQFLVMLNDHSYRVSQFYFVCIIPSITILKS